MKIVTVIGARPQFIKAAVVSRAIEKYNQMHTKSKRIDEVIIHIGQHYDVNMSDIFFEEMRISQPKYNLHIGGKTHGVMAGRILHKFEELLYQKSSHILFCMECKFDFIKSISCAYLLHTS